MNGMKLGVVLPTMSPRDGAPGDVAAAARHAEELGFESVWVVDQLIAGTGVPLLDSLTSLAAAAAVTERVGLGAAVLILPLRPVVWIAKQVASLQYLSGDRVLLGVGAGGDRHGASWAAAGIPQRSRGRRTDEALRSLPGLISGQPVRLDPDGEEVVLSPGVKVPPIIVGGMSDAAATRAAAYGDGWFVLAAPPDIPRYQALAAERAATRGRPAPATTTNAMVALDGDPHLPGRDALMRHHRRPVACPVAAGRGQNVPGRHRHQRLPGPDGSVEANPLCPRWCHRGRWGRHGGATVVIAKCAAGGHWEGIRRGRPPAPAVSRRGRSRGICRPR